VAVAGVLFFHAGQFGGGFLGVDLFFVLSGFLITGLLLKEVTVHGRLDLVAFWGRRVRRLLPALAVAVAGTVLLVWAFGTATQLRFAREDAPWVLGNLANWHFIADRIGYWDSAGTRVFSHLWSVAVEEQFYLVWPLVLGLAACGPRFLRRAGARRRARVPHTAHAAHRRVALVAAVGAVLSLVLMIVSAGPVDTTRVYEGTDTRAFSLLLGALMATEPAAGLLARLSDRVTGCLALALACGIGTYWVLADGQKSAFLFQGGLFLHALAAALLIGCLARVPDSPVGRVLGCAPLRLLGTVSYSLYLWHWPIYALLSEERLGLSGWSRTAVVVAVSVVAAVLSTHLVENPVRFRARWAHGRTGALALVAVLVALAGLLLAVPVPQAGVGSVDLTQLDGGG
jgi:peptidoglycan/LPS O-acetylase OafA/YrhL